MRYGFLAALAMAGCKSEYGEGTPVRATLGDGQVMAGEVRTATLRLETAMGTLDVPLEDVGEVVPVEGDDLGGAHGNVTVWLRNGSELVGRWADPELAMGLSVGGDIVEVDLPMDDLNRFQTTAGELWPEGTVYRVRTTHGDDFVVDSEASRVVLENDLGTFAPFLSECVSLAPIATPSGDWRIELVNGTVLIGPLADSEIVFALPNGPEQITVGLDVFVSAERQEWAEAPAPPRDAWGPAPAASPASAMPESGSGSGWFENGRLQDAKHEQYRMKSE